MNSRNGFTMIELILAIMLLAIMTVVTGLTFHTIIGNWQKSMAYIDNLQRAEYGVRQIVSGLRSAYCPSTGDSSGKYGFMLSEGANSSIRSVQSDIQWTKLGTSIVGNKSSLSDVPHRVRLWVKDERNLEKDEKPGLYAAIRRVDLVPEDEEEDVKDAEDELFEDGFLLMDGIRRFECRVVRKPDDAFSSKKQYEWLDQDKWTGSDSNTIPYKVELTFELEPVARGAEPAVIKRIVELPLWNVSQNPVKTDSKGKETEQKTKKGGT